MTGGLATGTVTGSVPGAPVSLSGAMVLAPAKSGTGSRQEFKVAIEVWVPLVGGKIENLIGSGLLDLLIAEHSFTTVWIAERARCGRYG